MIDMNLNHQKTLSNTLPEFNLYELIGLIIGDGHIIYDKKYVLEITGNADEDREYFNKVSDFIKKETGKTPQIRFHKDKRGKYIRLCFHNKEYIEFLIYKLGLVYKNKTFESEIPKKFVDWIYMKHIIRGLFEADGSLYFSKERREKHYYPRFEIKSSSPKIISQVMTSLKSQGFRVTLRRCGEERTFGIHLCGFNMLEKWIKEIGFGSFRNYSKYLVRNRLNFYIPKMNLKERIDLLRRSK